MNLKDAIVLPLNGLPDLHLTHEIDDAATHHALIAERVLIHLTGLWWGWGFQDLVNWYARQYRPVVIMRPLPPAVRRLREGQARPLSQHRRSTRSRRP